MSTARNFVCEFTGEPCESVDCKRGTFCVEQRSANEFSRWVRIAARYHLGFRNKDKPTRQEIVDAMRDPKVLRTASEAMERERDARLAEAERRRNSVAKR
jgi:hypothetical protein